MGKLNSWIPQQVMADEAYIYAMSTTWPPPWKPPYWIRIKWCPGTFDSCKIQYSQNSQKSYKSCLGLIWAINVSTLLLLTLTFLFKVLSLEFILKRPFQNFMSAQHCGWESEVYCKKTSSLCLSLMILQMLAKNTARGEMLSLSR